MNNTDKLLRAFIEASGYEIEEVRSVTETKEPVYNWPFKTDYLSVTHVDIDYKVTKPAPIMQHPVEFAQCDGDLFSLGCQVANDDIRSKLKLLGFELDKDQMHDVMETIIFHIARH